MKMLITELLELLKTLHEQGLNPRRHNLFAYGGEIVYSSWDEANRATEIIKKCSVVNYANLEEYANSGNVRIDIGTSCLVCKPAPQFHLYGIGVNPHCSKCGIKIASYMTWDGKNCVNCCPMPESSNLL